MATCLRRAVTLARVHQPSILSSSVTKCNFSSTSSSSDALIEVKPGEVGMISGIPEEHLRRRVCRILFIFICTYACYLVDSVHLLKII